LILFLVAEIKLNYVAEYSFLALNFPPRSSKKNFRESTSYYLYSPIN